MRNVTDDLTEVFPLSVYVAATAEIIGGKPDCRHTYWDKDSVFKNDSFGRISCMSCGARLIIEVAQ